MHILFIVDNFPPEGNAPATRTFEHAREWVIKGHKVTIITSAPNFPKGKVFEGFKNKWLFKEIVEGINVWRVKTYIAANSGFFKRTVDFLSFMISSFFFGLFTKKVDVVVGTSPQFFTVISACALAKVKRVIFIFELRDLWPASILELGVIKNNLMIRFLERLEFFLYRQSDLIIVVTHSFQSVLQDRGIPVEKIRIVLNGVDLIKYSPLEKKDPAFLEKYLLKEKFVVGYVGTHGLAHALDNIIDTAELLRNKDNIRIIFAGDGADRSRLEKSVVERGLLNIVMIPQQSKDQMPQLLSICDVSLVHLKNSPLFKTVIPSKIFESMGMGLPIIISMPEGEATEIIRSKNCGLVVLPERSHKLSEAILKLEKEIGLREDMAAASLIAAQTFDRKKLAFEMLCYIEETVKRNQSSR